MKYIVGYILAQYIKVVKCECVFEFEFENGTQAIAESSAFSIAGGGDTLAAIAKYGIASQVGYISIGGGAFLEVLEGKTLPAFEILQKRAVE